MDRGVGVVLEEAGGRGVAAEGEVARVYFGGAGAERYGDVEDGDGVGTGGGYCGGDGLQVVGGHDVGEAGDDGVLEVHY